MPHFDRSNQLKVIIEPIARSNLILRSGTSTLDEESCGALPVVRSAAQPFTPALRMSLLLPEMPART
jgi:hypothetical protein